MSQGGSRRPYSRGGPRWHPLYKDYWDYEQNYSDGSSNGSPKEACVAQSPPPAPAPPGARPKREQRPPQHERRVSLGGAGGSRRAERRAAPPDPRRDVRPPPPAAGPSAEGHAHHHAHSHHHHTHSHTHHMDTNPLEGGGGDVGGAGGSSDGDLSSKHGDSPTRKRRRISRHLSTGDTTVPVPPPPVERRTPRHHYQPPRRMRLVNNGAAVWTHEHLLEPHHTPLLLDINQMSLRGARLGALGGAVPWAHRDHAPRTQVGGGAGDVWGAAVLPPVHQLRYQMGGVYAGLQYHGSFAPPPPPRGPFASPPHAHPAHHAPHHAHHAHYIPNSQRAEGGRLDLVGGGEGGLSPLQTELHHAPLLLATEARGAPLELMTPHHHARHALSHHHHHHDTCTWRRVVVPAAEWGRCGRRGGRRRRGRGRRGGRRVARRARVRARGGALAAPPAARARGAAAGGGRGAAAARAAAAAGAAAHLPGVPQPAGDVPAVAVRAARGARRLARDRELRGAAVAGGETGRGQAARARAPGDRPAAQLQVLRTDAPGRADVVRGVYVRVRGAPDAARAAVRARVPRQVRRQVAPVEPDVSHLPRERVRVLQQLGVTSPAAGGGRVTSRAARRPRAVTAAPIHSDHVGYHTICYSICIHTSERYFYKLFVCVAALVCVRVCCT